MCCAVCTTCVLTPFVSPPQVLAETEEAQICVLRSLYNVWKDHPQMMCVLVDKMLKAQIVECSAVANWIFSREMNAVFLK